MTQSGPIIDFFYGRSFSIHSQAPSVGTETQIPCNKRNNASDESRPSDNGGKGRREGEQSPRKKFFCPSGLSLF